MRCSASRLNGGNAAAEFIYAGNPAEEGFNVVKRSLLDVGWSGLVSGVSQHDAEVFKKKAVAQGRLDANIGSDAGKYQIADAARTQHAVEAGIVKTAVARFRQDDITVLRTQLIDQVV